MKVHYMNWWSDTSQILKGKWVKRVESELFSCSKLLFYTIGLKQSTINILKTAPLLLFFLLLLSLWPHPVYHVPVCSHFLPSPAKLSTTTDVGLQTGRQLGEGATCIKRKWGRERAHCRWRMRPVFHRQFRFCLKVVIRPHKHFINSLLTCTHTSNTSKHAHVHTVTHTLTKYLRQCVQGKDKNEAYLSCLA